MALLGRLKEHFCYENEPLEIVQHVGKWIVKHSTGPLDLDIHLIYIARNRKDRYDGITKQELKDTGGYNTLWDTVHQYKCKPPSNGRDRWC